MKTKFTLLTVLGIFLSFTVKAQTSDAEAEAMANLLGVQKKEAVSKLVPVSGKDSINFWKIYDEYQRANMNTIKKGLNYMKQLPKLIKT